MKYTHILRNKMCFVNVYSPCSFRDQLRKMRGKPLKRSREWIIEKKERRRRQGKATRNDTKYTGRKRSGRF
jgi:18S rRNA (guanine1575-N7)-methyltransferase